MKILKNILASFVISFAWISAGAQPRLIALEYDIYFKGGKYSLTENCLVNPQLLASLKDSIPQTFRKGYFVYTLKNHGVMGVESPCGDYSENDTIARKRAESMADWLKAHTILTKPHIQYRGNDWLLLLSHIGEEYEDLPYKNEVKEIIYNNLQTLEESPEISAKLLVQLKELRGGEPYKYIEENVFPRMRYCKVYAYYYSQPKEKNVFPIKPVFSAFHLELPMKVEKMR
jgi:hypothetical protein